MMLSLKSLRIYLAEELHDLYLQINYFIINVNNCIKLLQNK